MSEDLKEACGLFGVFGESGGAAAEKTYLGLFSLQHRGQESAGICARVDGRLQVSVSMGLVAEAFPKERLDKLRSDCAIGHVRYSTAGSSTLNNAQPMLVDTAGGQIAVAHNGNLTNGHILRGEFEAHGSIFRSTSDTETILHMLAQPHVVQAGEEGFAEVCRRIQGAFSLLFLTPEKMIAVRDPHGFRPLSIGVSGTIVKTYCFASETCAFALIGATHEGDVQPGEMVVVDGKEMRRVRYADTARPRHCVFEHVYFSRPDSVVFGDNVHAVRLAMGRRLAREHPVAADVVIAVPDSGNDAAIGYSMESGIPFDTGFIRNHYVGRTFLKPRDEDRTRGVDLKLNVVNEVVAGRRVVCVDDSIVRGHTALRRVRALKQAGAREVHLRVSSPPVRNPCYYGIDFPTRSELVAANKSVDDIRAYLQIDSLGYLSLEGMLATVSAKPEHYCTACYTGDYPLPLAGEREYLRSRTRK
ncbi:MAG: amidophosphoribosyltransferase [Planctomycetes bacterium]|nr:amidophosphoribosyltransferase [Planctomycetota bacterium]